MLMMPCKIIKFIPEFNTELGYMVINTLTNKCFDLYLKTDNSTKSYKKIAATLSSATVNDLFAIYYEQKERFPGNHALSSLKINYITGAHKI
ncbi:MULTISPECIES: hypothetical protein [Clostridium]|uniref:hypothetical protein n=1 Tax=Clostridium TaxID=1485 RepID=UPI0008249D6B|nr:MULTISPECIES: hypothetical protein [Clostridium]PJI10547.1 hypothetical protein CUB90_00700 [Clostridium sp. CT7]